MARRRRAKKTTKATPPPDQSQAPPPADDQVPPPSKEDQTTLPVTEPPQKSSEPKKEKSGKPDEPDFKCRRCKHYPLRGQGPVTSIVEGLRVATNNGRKTYCGEKPLRTEGKLKGEPIDPRIDCTGKKFELDEF